MPRVPGVRFRRGVTLLEIMVVLSIIASLSAAAAGLFPGPIQYFRARRSMETLMWSFRKVQQLARSRGHSQNTGVGGPMGASTDPSFFGLKIYRGSMVFNGATLAPSPDGYSYIAFGPSNRVPPDTLGALNAIEGTQVVNLDPSLIPVNDGAVDRAVRGLPAKVVFTRDVLSGLGDIVPDGTSDAGAGCPTCPTNLDFLLQNFDGYFRIQIENQRFIGMRYVPL